MQHKISATITQPGLEKLSEQLEAALYLLAPDDENEYIFAFHCTPLIIATTPAKTVIDITIPDIMTY